MKSMNYFIKYMLLLLPLLSTAQSKNNQLKSADSLFRASNYALSATYFEGYLIKNQKGNISDVAYKAAISFAKINNPQKAIFWLQKAVDNDADDTYLTKTRFSIDFYPIRHTKEWQLFIETNLGDFDKDAQSVQYPEIRNELLDLWQSDQYYRQLIFGRYKGRPPMELGNVTESVDRFNTKRLEEIVNEIGWPTFSKVGKDGAHAAWNIIQHAVFNPPFMKICLREMKLALKNNQVDGVDYAYLYDRFQAVCYIDKIDYGIVRGVPIRDGYDVDKRRKMIGFKETVQEYLGSYTPISKEEYEANDKKLELEYKNFILQGKDHFNAGSLQKAAESYNRALDSYGYVLTEDIYEYARLLALLDTPRSKFNAIRMIRSLAARGYSDVEKIKAEEAFKNILENENFIEIISIIEKYNF